MVLPPIKNKDSWELCYVPGFLCFILDTSWVKSRELTIEILFFPSSEKTFLCLRALPLMSGRTLSIHHITSYYGGVAVNMGGTPIQYFLISRGHRPNFDNSIGC